MPFLHLQQTKNGRLRKNQCEIDSPVNLLERSDSKAAVFCMACSNSFVSTSFKPIFWVFS